MNWIDYLFVLAIANLITEQKIARRFIDLVFKPDTYLEWSKWKVFIFDLISCGPCFSFWVGLFYGSIQYGFLNGLVMGLVVMFIYSVIEKFKRN